MLSDVSVADFNADGMDNLFCRSDDGNTSVAISIMQGYYSTFYSFLLL